MKGKMNSRYYIMVCGLVLSALLAATYWWWPSMKGNSAEGFSALRAVDDIRVISQEHHSVAHPEAKTAVGTYLMNRLEQLGGNVTTYVYPSVKAKGFTFDVTDILAEFPPPKAMADTTWLMLVAHYDSRYPWIRLGKEENSFGAADDGYGLSVILECVKGTLQYRSEWVQGIKVLFTDAEEVGMEGMKAIYQQNREVFEDVGLLINVESRGPFGPCLLFETSSGNERIIELYADNARYPYAYSLTNAVYRSMPNATDFTVVKDSIPGMNFSAVADINHYHTDLDNFDHVNPYTLQHYGEQIAPVVAAYLTNPAYADRNYFKAEKDVVNFSIPFLGLLHFPTSVYTRLNIVLVLLCLYLLYKKRKAWKEVVGGALASMGIALVAFVLGEIVVWGCTRMVGLSFVPLRVVGGIPFDNVAMLATVTVVGGALLLGYCKLRSLVKWSYGVMLALGVLSAVLYCTLGENMMFFIPLCCMTMALLLWKITSSRLFLLLGMMLLLLHAVSFLYILGMALTIGMLGVLLFIAAYDFMALFALARCYLTKEESK